MAITVSSEILDRLPPSDLDAEQQTIGSALLEPSILDELTDIVSPKDFHSDAHRRILSTLLAMSASGTPISTSTIVQHLKHAAHWEAIGGAVTLAELMSAVATHAHWAHHAAIVREHAQRRQIIAAATETLRDGYDTTQAPDATLSAAEDALAAISTGDYDNKPIEMWDAVTDVMAEIDQIMERQQRAGILTGLHRFDQDIGGVFPGELAIIGARPGQGKTSLAIQMAAHMAHQGKRVYFATLEMAATELALKRLCSEAGVSSQKVRAATLDSEDRAQLAEACARVASRNFFLHDWPTIKPNDIHRAARRLKADVVFVDYLQIVTPPDASKKRYEQVGDVSFALKTISRRLNVPVIACAQIGRQAEQGKELPPRLSHLRESGNIENDADVVLLLYRPKNGREDGELRWDADLEVAKNRKGITAALRLDWHADTTTFECRSAVSFEDDAISEDKHGWKPF